MIIKENKKNSKNVHSCRLSLFKAGFTVYVLVAHWTCLISAFPTVKSKKITPPRPVEPMEEETSVKKEPPVFILSGMSQAVRLILTLYSIGYF